ncbi:MAG TPA: hypothetical protein VF581_06055 [Flavobacterium sp.]|jgi:hypothetical protein
MPKFLILLFCLFSEVAISQEVDEPDIADLLQQGAWAFSNGNLELSERCFARIAVLDSTHTTALYNLGIIRLEQFDTIGSIKYFQRSVQFGDRKAADVIKNVLNQKLELPEYFDFTKVDSPAYFTYEGRDIVFGIQNFVFSNLLKEKLKKLHSLKTVQKHGNFIVNLKIDKYGKMQCTVVRTIVSDDIAAEIVKIIENLVHFKPALFFGEPVGVGTYGLPIVI